MPWHIEYGNTACNDDQWAVVKDADGSVEGCHDTRADAISQMQALYANEPEAAAVTAAAIEHEGPQSGAMIAFLPTEADQKRLALDGYEPADQLHVTSCYLGDAAMIGPDTRAGIEEAVTAAASRIPQFAAKAFAASIFNPTGDEPCLVLGLSGSELAAAQVELAAVKYDHAASENHQPWVPHITLAYDTDPVLLLGPDIWERMAEPIIFDRIRIAYAGEATDIPLGSPQAIDEPVDEEAQAMVAAMPAIGTPWTVLVPEGVWGDKRQLAPDSITWADLPLPFKAQFAEEDGHGGAVIAGRIDTASREPGGVRFSGVFDDAGVAGAEALRLVRGGFLRGVSPFLDSIDEADIEMVWGDPIPVPEPPPLPDMEMPEPESTGNLPIEAEMPELDVMIDEMEPAPEMYYPEPSEIYHAGRVRSLTLVAEPAFAESVIELIEVPAPEPTRVTIASGYTITIPDLWPEEWFAEPEPEAMPEFGALRITASGRITGYLAPPGVVHRAFRRLGKHVTVPTKIDYSEFNNKPALVATRTGGAAAIPAGNITFNCGHPDPYDPRRADPSWAREVYDNSCSVVARVRIWESPRYPGAPIVAGALLHGVDADAIERMMGCALSGDWGADGKLNAALLVPVEGFPTSVTASVRVRDGHIVASSVPVHFEARAREQLDALARRIGADPASQFAKLRERIGM